MRAPDKRFRVVKMSWAPRVPLEYLVSKSQDWVDAGLRELTRLRNGYPVPQTLLDFPPHNRIDLEIVHHDSQLLTREQAIQVAARKNQFSLLNSAKRFKKAIDFDWWTIIELRSVTARITALIETDENGRGKEHRGQVIPLAALRPTPEEADKFQVKPTIKERLTAIGK